MGADLSNLRRIGSAGLAVSIIVFFSLKFPNTFTDQFWNNHFRSLECLTYGQVVCPRQELKDGLEINEFIRFNTENHASVISIPPANLGGAVRFQALHPVVFIPTDMIRLAPGNLSSAIAMEKDVQEWSKIDLLPEDEKLQKYLEFARRKQAELAIIRNPIPEWLIGKVIFRNQTYSLISLER